jgi:hypothetical protein
MERIGERLILLGRCAKRLFRVQSQQNGLWEDHGIPNSERPGNGAIGMQEFDHSSPKLHSEKQDFSGVEVSALPYWRFGRYILANSISPIRR